MKRSAAGDLFKRALVPRQDENRCNNAMALWHRVLRRPPVLAPTLRTRPDHG